MEERMRLENRLAMRIIASALETEAVTLLSRQKLETKLKNQRDDLKKRHVHILAYKYMVEYLIANHGLVVLDRQAEVWQSCVARAVEHIRSKGEKLEDKHIPQLRPESTDLGKVDILEIEVRESSERPFVGLAREVETLVPFEVVMVDGFPEDVWRAFHKVWTFCVGKQGYDKEEFRLLEAELLRMHRGDEPKRVVHVEVDKVLDRVRHLESLPDSGDPTYEAETSGRVAELLALIGTDVQEFRASEVSRTLGGAEKAAG